MIVCADFKAANQNDLCKYFISMGKLITVHILNQWSRFHSELHVENGLFLCADFSLKTRSC